MKDDYLTPHKLAISNININKELDRLIEKYEYESCRLNRPISVDSMLYTLNKLKYIADINNIGEVKDMKEEDVKEVDEEEDVIIIDKMPLCKPIGVETGKRMGMKIRKFFGLDEGE